MPRTSCLGSIASSQKIFLNCPGLSLLWEALQLRDWCWASKFSFLVGASFSFVYIFAFRLWQRRGRAIAKDSLRPAVWMEMLSINAQMHRLGYLWAVTVVFGLCLFRAIWVHTWDRYHLANWLSNQKTVHFVDPNMHHIRHFGTKR